MPAATPLYATCLAVALATTLPGTLAAQALPSPAGAHRAGSAAAPSMHARALRSEVPHIPPPGDTTRPSVKPYLAVGAVAGIAAMGAVLAIAYQRSDSEGYLMSPFALVPPFAAAGVVGAGIGFLVHAARHPAWVPPQR